MTAPALPALAELPGPTTSDGRRFPLPPRPVGGLSPEAVRSSPPLNDRRGRPGIADCFRQNGVEIHFGAAERMYAGWPAPVCLIVDGPYGVSGFPGDLPTASDLADWYRPHIREWTTHSTPQTTLWFWNTELGWATVHPVLLEHGWEFRSCHVWDKGLGHVAGNSNTATLRKFPVVTEVCVQYVLPMRFAAPDRPMSAQDWLRTEWQRTGLPYRLANEACGVRNAATRKYLTSDHLWYYPPPALFERLARYANEHGDPAGRPYFSLDGQRPLTADDWSRMRAKFRCSVGITNVWRHPQVSGRERIRGVRSRMKWKYRSLHGSQKPLALIRIAMDASTEPKDVVWEPFGGLCPAALAAAATGRRCFSAEIVPEFYEAAVERIRGHAL